MEERKDIELEVRGNRIVIPGALVTVIMVGVTAALFAFLENPETAALASAGFAVLVMIAKLLDVNMDHVLTVLGKTSEDIPDPAGFPTRAAYPATSEEEPQIVHVKPAGKVRAWFFG